MKEIKMLAQMMEAELDDAHEYIKEALHYKHEDTELANMFYELSKQEVEHSHMEHEQAVRLIKAYNKEAPAAMKAVWDWQHDRLIEHEADIKRLMAMFRE